MTNVISLGELVVEFFRKKADVPYDKPSETIGPYPSGAPAIFIDCCARLGLNTAIFGTIGKDDFGKCIMDRLISDGVNVSHIISLLEYTTGTAFTKYSSKGERSFIYHMPHAAPGQFNFGHLNKNLLKETQLLHISGNVLSISDTAKETCYKAAEIVKSYGGKISFDPNLRPELMTKEEIRNMCKPIFNITDIFLPSENEISMFADELEGKEACNKIIEKGIKLVALKMGKLGSLLANNKQTVYLPSYDVKEIDPTGAGDCFDAGVVYGYLNNWDLEKTGQFANALGAMTVKKQGPMEGEIKYEKIMKMIK